MSLLAALLVAASSASAETSATVDLTQSRQVVDALGVNANVHSWDAGALRPAIDQIGAMGATTWRVIIDRADWEAANDNADSSSFDWDAYRQIYEHGKMADLWDTIAAIEARPGQRVMISAMGGVPDWMGGSRIDADNEDEWVEMMASLVSYGVNERHLRIDLLSPMNEPDWDGNEGPQVGAEQYVRLLHKLASRLDALGLGAIKFVGPDTADVSLAAQSYYPAMAQDAFVMAHTEAIGIHNYAGTTGGIGDAIAGSAFSSTPFWLTEFSTWCGGCDRGAPNPDDWSFARGNVEQLLGYLDAGAAGAQIYDAWDGFYEHHDSVGYWGLLAYDATTGTYKPRKSYYALQQVYVNVPPGARLVESSSSSDSPIDIHAFHDRDSNRVTIVLLNKGSESEVVSGSILGPASPRTLKSRYTSAAADYAPAADVTVGAGGDFTVHVPADSVETLTGTADGSPSTDPPAPSSDVPDAPPPLEDRPLLGNTSIENLADSVPVGTAEAFRTTVSASGAIRSLRVYLDASSDATALIAGVYTDSGGNPATLVAQGRLATPTPGGWNTVDLPATQVVQGDHLWLAVLGSGGTLSFRDRDGGGDASLTSASPSLSTLPREWETERAWQTTGISAFAVG